MVADGGIGTYLTHVVPRVAELRPDWRFTAFGPGERMRASGWDAIGNLSTRSYDAPIYGLREQVELPIRLPRDASLYWAPHYNFSLMVNRPLVVTIHDVCHLALAELNGGALRSTYARYMLDAVRRRARGILFDSEFSRSEMNRLVGDCPANAAVSPLAVDEVWWRAKELCPIRPVAERYLLYVGNLKRHKNVPALVSAFRSVASRVPHRLLIVGRSTGLRADPSIEMDVDERVLFTGEVSAERLMQFVAHADAFVTASRYEGFGLPALESMAVGVPCLVSRAGSLPEVCGDAALYCDPADTESIAGGILRILTDDALRRELVARGTARARAFSWSACARTTTDVLERALA